MLASRWLNLPPIGGQAPGAERFKKNPPATQAPRQLDKHPVHHASTPLAKLDPQYVDKPSGYTSPRRLDNHPFHYDNTPLPRLAPQFTETGKAPSTQSPALPRGQLKASATALPLQLKL